MADTNIDYDVDKANKYLPESLREFVAANNRMSRENLRTFFTMYQGVEQLAIYNNAYAAEFASGFVSSLNYRYLRSGVAPRLLDIFVSKTVGRVYYQTEIPEQDLNDKLNKDVFSDALTKATAESAMTGRSLMVAYQPEEKGIISISTYNLFRHKVRFNKKNEIIEAWLYMFNRDAGERGSEYTIAEHRFYKVNPKTGLNAAYQEYVIYKSTWQSETKDDARVTILDTKSIPDDIKAEYKKSGIEFNRATELTFKTIAVVDIKFSEVNKKFMDSNIPEAMFIDAVDNVTVIDTAITDMEIEKENGRGQVLIPELNNQMGFQSQMSGSRVLKTVNTSFKNPTMIAYPTLKLEDNKPTNIQFDIRSDQWIQQINDDIARLCASVGISVLDYDPRLLQQGQRTDDEINAMTDITASTVKAFRDINTKKINDLLETIIEAAGLEKPVAIRWSQASILNPSKNASLVIQKLNAGLISRKRAIKEIYPDLTDSEIEEMYKEIKTEMDEMAVSNRFNNF